MRILWTTPRCRFLPSIPESGEKATISETDHFSPESVNGAYAKTKAEATQAVLDAARRGLNAGAFHVGRVEHGRNAVADADDAGGMNHDGFVALCGNRLPGTRCGPDTRT